MTTTLTDIIVGIMMLPLCLLGLLMASRAEDAEIYVFGLSLAGFSLAFGMNVLRAYLADAQVARVPAMSGASDD